MGNKEWTIREIKSESDLDQVYKITYQRYYEKGYCSYKNDGRFRHYSYLDRMPETTIFGAFSRKNELIGTLSLTIDGERGLHTDEEFPDTMKQIRNDYMDNEDVLCAAWRIASYNDKVTFYLMDKCFYKIIKTATIAICDVNPCHKNFYNRIFCFDPLVETSSESVNSAPAVLMIARVENMAQWIGIRKRFLK